MAQKSPGITEAFAAFVLSIHEERYYDAHEDLEVIWYPRRFEEDDEVRLWKGFINAAVSFELIRRGRPEASLKALATYHKYYARLEKLVTPHKELYVKIAALIEEKHSSLFSLQARS